MFIFSWLLDPMTSVLLKRSFSVDKLSLVRTSLNRSTRVLLSCEWRYLNLPSFNLFKLNAKTKFTFAAHLVLLQKGSRFLSTNVALRFPNAWLNTSFFCGLKARREKRERNASLASYHQHGWWYDWSQLSLSFYERHAECFYDVVKRKNLENLRSKVHLRK